MNDYLDHVSDSTSAAIGFDLMKKLPWSLAFAVIPFIPDILVTIRNIPDQMARNGYGLYVKHGETEIHFNKGENVSNSLNGGASDGEDN